MSETQKTDNGNAQTMPNRGPTMPGYEDYVCGYCKYKGHWSPDCQLKADHVFEMVRYEWEDALEKKNLTPKQSYS